MSLLSLYEVSIQLRTSLRKKPYLTSLRGVEVKIKTLRFAIGERVKCNTHSGWKKGKVVAHQYRDEYMDPGVVAPYQVTLANQPRASKAESMTDCQKMFVAGSTIPLQRL